MTVYARGYRPYAGAFTGVPGWWVILVDTARIVLRRKSMVWLRRLFVLALTISVVGLYVSIQKIEEAIEQRGLSTDRAQLSWEILRGALSVFYGGMTGLTAIAALLGGAGLVADDLRTRALPLYLVRPIRPFDYALGKALVLPAVLFLPAFLPGPVMLLLTASWQEPGKSSAFLADHAGIVTACARHYAIAAAGYAGLMLLLSSRTAKRGVVVSLGAAAVFGGSVLQGVGIHTKGVAGEVLRTLGLPVDTMFPILRVTAEGEGWLRRAERRDMDPDPTWVTVFVLALLLVGFVSAWRRARTVEVTG